MPSEKRRGHERSRASMMAGAANLLLIKIVKAAKELDGLFNQWH